MSSICANRYIHPFYMHRRLKVKKSNMSIIGDRRILSRIIFPISVLLTLVIAYLLDMWLFTQTRLSRQLGLLGLQDPVFLWTVVSGVVLFAVWLALSWVALARSRPSLPVSIIVLVIGLVFYVYPYLQMSFAWVPYLFLMVRTPLNYTGLFVAVLSILQLLVRTPSQAGG